jgi:CheY-like chemotaxis protein
MNGAGELSLRTCNVYLDQSFTSLYKINTGNYVEMSVTDSGKGMDASIRNRVFEPFFTTREIGGGTGMGLASAFGIIKNHGGYIECDSAPGQGSTFRIYLPVSTHSNNHSTSLVEELERGTETILLVDDEEFILKICTKLLNQLGYHVITAESGPKAIEIFISKKDQIDLVILDMLMPLMNGAEVARNIRSVAPDIGILISSGYNLEEERDKQNSDFNGYIQKPFKLQELSTAIRNIIPKKGAK